MADKLNRYRKENWDVCWVETGSADDLDRFLGGIPAGAKKAIEAHLYVIALMGPKGQCKPIEGQDGLYEVKEKHDGNYYRVFCFYSKTKSRFLFLLGSCYLKKAKKIPSEVLKRALDVKARAEYLPPPPS